MMNELSLFTGAGGGVLGSILLGHRIVGYVENNEYCQKIIAQRIKDGIFDEAPIFGDIRDFNSQGYAESYKGLVDVVSGGFPCQDISCAGKGAGITGERSGLWFEMETAIRIIRPRFVFIENSPMLLVRGFEHIICAFSEMGYSARWGIISAADVGAPHLRKRLWILAHSISARTWDQSKKFNLQGRVTSETKPKTIRQGVGSVGASGTNSDGKDVANASRIQQERQKQWTKRQRTRKCCESINVADTHQFNDDYGRFGTGKICRKQQKSTELSRSKKTISYTGKSQWNRGCRGEKAWLSIPESKLGRVAHGVANRVDRLKAIGNGQVPLVAATAWRILSGE